MIKEDQANFYKVIGKLVKEARIEQGLSIPEVVKLSGEQYKTINSIEKGSTCQMHQLLWIKQVLNIDIYKEIHSGKPKTIIDDLF